MYDLRLIIKTWKQHRLCYLVRRKSVFISPGKVFIEIETIVENGLKRFFFGNLSAKSCLS